MDVILNARPPVTEYSEDILMEALELSQAALPREHYDFGDEDSLEQYWADQASLWRGAGLDQMHYPSDKRYQVSAERSTVYWQVGESEDENAQVAADEHFHLDIHSFSGSSSPPSQS